MQIEKWLSFVYQIVALRLFSLLFIFLSRGFLRRDCAIADVPLVVQSVIVVLWKSTM